MKKIIVVVVIVVMLVSFSACKKKEREVEKPVIYLYSEVEMDARVELECEGDIICTYPKYGNGWNVKVYPDGRLLNYADRKMYSSLFWEGVTDIEFDMSKGFVVSGDATASFLDEKLETLGLNREERNEFIVYWLPKMQENAYNFITFQTDVYTDYAKLKVDPEPDSMIRVFMAYKPLRENKKITEQKLETPERKGFTVVEWGGCEVN